jgi:Fe2+ transport system protein FeoA
VVAQRLQPSSPQQPLALADFEPGRGVVVVAVEIDGPEAQRLLDLGFVPGTPVRVVGRAPLGDPTVYSLRGIRLCLRQSEARRIAVRPAST